MEVEGAPRPFPLPRSSSPALDAAALVWRVCLDQAEPGTGWLFFSMDDAAELAGIRPALAQAAFVALADLLILLPSAALHGHVSFKLNLEFPPSWAADASVWPYPPRLRDLLRSHGVGA